tara:strand:+ start:432 stop:1622 length:1191 start_codon:yes stop_codon:yes gene_type:complete
MNLNLYQLCDKKHNKGSIKAILNNDLKDNIKKSLLELKKQKVKFKDVSKQVGIDYITLWKHINKRNSISLTILTNLENISGIDLRDSINELTLGRKNYKIKCPNKINEELAKIIGAIIADGHLRYRKSKRGYHYELVIVEGFKSNVDAFSKWFNKVFGVKIIPKKENKYYLIYISNKIIFKFFNSVIGIPAGNKSSIVYVPEIVRNSNSNIKKAFLQGIFMFDGGVDYRTCYIDLVSKSRTLIKETNEILKQLKLEPDFVSLNPDNFGRYRLRFRKASKLKKCLQLFGKNTEKWFRLKEHLDGLETITKDLKIAIKSFDKYYPRVRKNSITFSDIIKTIYELKSAEVESVAKSIKRNKTVTYGFLNKLEKWNVFKSQRKGLNKCYQLNSILKIPRR